MTPYALILSIHLITAILGLGQIAGMLVVAFGADGSAAAPAWAALEANQMNVKSTRRDRTIYWTTTGIVCAVMVFSIINFVFNDHFPFPSGKEGAFVHLGLPNYFKVELTIAKTLGVLALLIPTIPVKIKEFAYFGFAITLLSAGIAHFARGDGELSILFVIDPLIFFGISVVSYWYFTKLKTSLRSSR